MTVGAGLGFGILALLVCTHSIAAKENSVGVF
jgi:hypothetical protein